MCAQGIRLINVWEEEYPKRLKEIPDAPYGLFVRGKLPEEEMLTVAVIGARECSEYGRFVAKQLGSALARHGVTVISGMARGIDGITQATALEAGGTSVGVLGSGVDVCYPAQNKALYEQLIRHGGVISSYPLGTPARPINFPPRNRIVSGLADVVVVIEARVKSGTLITVDMALEQGREVYVVPGRITDRLSDGCNRLIKQGAGVVLSPEEFVEEMLEIKNGQSGAAEKIVEGGFGTDREKEKLAEISPELAAIYQVLDFEPRTGEEIKKKLPKKYENIQITTHLMRLCMERRAVQVSPGRFCRGEN